jgi:hypothetical protein
MQGDEDDVRALASQPLHQIAADVDADRLVSQPPKGVLDPGGGAQRDNVLEGAASP